MIFCVLLPVQTNMYSEIMAIQLAAEICVHKGFTNVVIETDSTIARLIMIQEVSAPWAVDTIVRKIITLLRDKKMRFSHVYREGNAVADSLANYAIDEEISGTFEEFHQLPAQARKILTSALFWVCRSYLEEPNLVYYEPKLARQSAVQLMSDLETLT